VSRLQAGSPSPAWSELVFYAKSSRTGRDSGALPRAKTLSMAARSRWRRTGGAPCRWDRRQSRVADSGATTNGRRRQLAARIVNGPDALTNHPAVVKAYPTKKTTVPRQEDEGPWSVDTCWSHSREKPRRHLLLLMA